MTVKLEATMDEPRLARPMVRLVGGALGLMMLLGGAVGFRQAHAEAGGGDYSTAAWVVIAIWAALVAGCLWLIATGARTVHRESAKIPPRERRSTMIFAISLLIGAALGAMLWSGSAANPQTLTLYGPLPRNTAIFLAIFWGIALSVLTIWWVRTIDEHERAAYREGAEHAGHVLLIGLPLWWILNRGGIAPPVDMPISIGLFALVWVGVWIRRKYFD